VHIDIKPSAWNGLRSRSALRWAALLGATLVMLAVPAPRATAQAPAAEPAPVLLTEIGAHSAPIRRLSVDVPRGLVLTASDDRTARLWSLDTGALVRTLRPPVSGTRIGRLYGAALHPSRPIAAVAGTTGEGAAGAHSIYLFDLDTGRMQRRIDARAGDIKRLVWSADGSALFAAYAGADGVRAFSAEGALLFEQTLRGASYGLSAAADGTVAVATLQGDVLVVKAANGRIEAVRRFNIPTASPVGIALSPDGTRLAVGSFLGRVANRDSPAGITVRIGGASVDVIEVRSGSVLRTLTPPTLEEGNLMTVAWSGDGRTIFAGGTGYRGNRNFPLLRFDAETGRLVGEQTVASDSVQDLAVLPDGRVAFASFDGTWGTATPTAVNRYGSQALDFVRAPERLSIAADGRRIRWQPGVDGAPLEFDFDKRTLGPIEPGAAALAIGPTLGSESNRGQWLNNERPSFAGAPIRMDPGEVNRAIAELRGTRDRIYGTSFALMRVRPDGSIAWRRLMDAETRALVVNADGTQVIGAMSDGSLRWWRTADGEPTLGLLGTRDRRWIAWTPNGFYDASTAADRLAGWAISRRIDRESEFFPLNRFRDRFNRPDVIDQVLITADGRRAVEEAERIAQAGREQAPEPPPLIVPAPLASAQAEVAPPVVAPPAVVPAAVTPPVASPPVASPPVASPPVASPPIASPPVAAPPVTTAPLPPPPIAAPTVPAPPIAAPPIAAPPITAPPVTAPARPTPPPRPRPAPPPPRGGDPPRPRPRLRWRLRSPPRPRLARRPRSLPRESPSSPPPWCRSAPAR
jgi:WD40 repeat protein